MSKTYKIAQIPGDRTGPEVLKEGIKVVEEAAKRIILKLNGRLMTLAEKDI